MTNTGASRRSLLRFFAGSPLLASIGGIGSLTALGRAAAQSGAPPGFDENAIIQSAAEALNVFDFEAAFRSRTNPGHFAYQAQGSDDSEMLAVNRAGFEKFELKPRRLVDVGNVDLSVELFGQRFATPIGLAPCGAQGAFNPEGEVAVARGAKTANALQILSTVTNFSVEDVAAAREAPIWFQLYPTNKWTITEGMIKRAERAGCTALVFTVDLPARNLEWINRFRRDESPFCQTCHQPGFEAAYARKPMFDGVSLDGMQMSVRGLTWDYVDRLRDATSMKVLLKGIVTAEDAERCLEHGVDGIVVANAGGRRDVAGTSSIESLVEVLGAVRGRVPVLVDSGFRRGTDIFKALALGASAVCVGRPYLWGLGAFGQEGVERVLALLARELGIVMTQMGTPNVASITRASLKI